jgi:hypothetical protein
MKKDHCMKKAVILISFLLLAVNFSALESADSKEYQNQSLGVTFNYPNPLTIDEKNSRQDPLSVVFNYGQPPFAVSILFKEVMGSTNLDEFIIKERQGQEAGGYRAQIEENKYTIEGKISAIEFIRTSEMGTIYYYIFLSQKSDKLLAFWHMTSKIADPDEKAVEAYRIIRESLKISNP